MNRRSKIWKHIWVNVFVGKLLTRYRENRFCKGIVTVLTVEKTPARDLRQYFFKEEQVAMLKGKTSSFQYKSDSGNSKTKLFCQRCGSVVLGSNSGRPGIISVYVGTLDDASFVTPQFNVYTSRALPFVKIDESLNNCEEGRQ